MCLEVRGQAAGAGSFSSLCEPQGWSSGCQAWWQAPSSFPESEGTCMLVPLEKKVSSEQMSTVRSPESQPLSSQAFPTVCVCGRRAWAVCG